MQIPAKKIAFDVPPSSFAIKQQTIKIPTPASVGKRRTPNKE